MSHPSLISAEQLYDRLDDPRVTIVDCRFALMQPEVGRQQYQISHIPGAHYLDLNQDLSSPPQQHGGRHPLPDPQKLAETLSQLGIQSQETGQPTLVIAYDDSRFAYAARLWWLLHYLGHDQVAVLDGGFSGWQSAGYPTNNELPQGRSGTFIPQLRPDMKVDIAIVRERKDRPHVVLVDSREADRYRGEREPIDPVAGHIPGAMNYPWQSVTTEAGYAYNPSEQHQRWQTISTAEEVIVYCGSGVTACVNLLSLDLAGIKTGKLYAGSWSDWCSYL